jgi:hypothetical protein
VSRGFISALIGVAMTLLAWYGPWEWPAWPAFTVIRVVFGTGDPYQDLSYSARAAVLTGLIIVNVGFWAAIAWSAARLAQCTDRVARS